MTVFTTDLIGAWYQQAVFYELAIDSFYDGNGDGVGDAVGLVEKLDYLQWLGVDCLVLTPFMDSPQRDDGYDISSFVSVLPDYGDLNDMVDLIEQARKRGIRVIGDLVLSHTSDEHAWFGESRQDRTNAKADWYVWSDDDRPYAGTSVVLAGAEGSNWAWDAQRRQYYGYWLFTHEPALNYDNPEVQQAMCDAVAYWLDMGFDGMRLLGASHLMRSIETSTEDRLGPHGFLKRLRRSVDERHPGRLLVVAVDEPPADAAAYAGTGDQCQLVLDYSFSSRLLMTFEERTASDSFDLLPSPAIPAACQWGIPLRGYDAVGARGRQSGVGDDATPVRRLSPKADNDLALAQLAVGLCLSLAGSPFLYYGDEIGMGDPPYEAARTRLRTPMQWTPDRNAGFSRADYADLFRPPLLDPIYGYQAVNVEGQVRNPSSHLQWIQRMLQVRRVHRDVFGSGSFQVVPTSNHAIFAFTRGNENETLLCVNNLSTIPQPVELDLTPFSGAILVELLGRVPFPVVRPAPYFVSLAPYEFFWLQFADGGDRAP